MMQDERSKRSCWPGGQRLIRVLAGGRRQAIGLLLLLDAFCAAGLPAATYSIQGHLTYEPQMTVTESAIASLEASLGRNPDLRRVITRLPTLDDFSRPLHRRFLAEVDNECRWKVTVFLDSNPDFHAFVSQYDNQHLVHYALGSSTNLGLVSVHTKPVPYTRTTAADEIVWLALASGCYFLSTTNGMAVSLKSSRAADGTLRRQAVPVVVEASESPPHLPSLVQYGIPEATLRSVPRLRSRQSSAAPDVAMNIAAELKSEEFTRIGAAAFPSRFQYREFAPKVSADGGRESPVTLLVRGYVTEITAESRGIDFRLPDRMAVGDHRDDVPTALYTVTDGVIPPIDSQVVKEARRRAQLLNQGAVQRVWGIREMILFAIGALAVAAFPVCLVLRGRKSSGRVEV
jgi:hypothetical protein